MNTVQAFIEEHGGPMVFNKGVIHCKDGATIREGSVFMQPHINPTYRLKARRKYHALLLDRTTKEYNKLFAALEYGAIAWRYPDAADWFYKHLVGQDGRPIPDDVKGYITLAVMKGIIKRQLRNVAALDAEIGQPVFSE